MSENMRQKLMSNNISFSNEEFLQEDLYCFGFCIIYLMTGIHPNKMAVEAKRR
jgi:hypothetical protein